MLELKRKASLVFLIYMLTITSVYAGYWVYSKVLTVEVTYKLTLGYTLDGANVTLTATLTGNEVSGVDVEFYNCTDASGSGRTLLGASTTSSVGVATYTWTATANGTYYFQAGYEVP